MPPRPLHDLLRDAVTACPLLDESGRSLMLRQMRELGPELEAWSWLPGALDAPAAKPRPEAEDAQRERLLNAFSQLLQSNQEQRTLPARLFLALHWERLADMYLEGSDAEAVALSPFMYTML